MQRFLVLVQRRAAYLWVLFLIPAASQFGHYLAPNEPVFKGHDYGILVAAVLTLVSAALWIPYSRRGNWPRSSWLFFSIAAIAWTYQVVRIQLDDSLFNLTVFVVPMALLLVALKRPSQQEMWIAVWILGYSLLVIATVSLVFGALGVTPNGFEVSDGGGSRFQWMEDIGLTRWGGPFGSVNYAAPVGGLLVVIGLTGRRRQGLPLIIGGLAILVLSQGRTALFAMVAAVTVQLLWSKRFFGIPHIRWIRTAVLSTFVVGTLSYILLFDPTLAYRTYLWSDYAVMFDDSPLLGVGDSGIRQHVAEQARIPGALLHDHAHSVLLDAYVRFGAVLLVLGVGMYFLALRGTMRALRQVGSGPLAVVIFVIVAGLTETIYAWAHWSIYLVALTWAVMVSSPDTSSGERVGDEPRSLSWASESG